MLVRRFIELLTPTECFGCGADNVVLCTTCTMRFGLRDVNICYACRLPSPAAYVCKRCASDMAMSGVAVAAYYDGPVKELILSLKFQRLRAAADAAAALITATLPSWPIDMVTSVPISPARHRERGYNQSELLARRVAEALDRPYTPLLARANSQHQLGLDRRSRLRSAGGFFAVRRCEGHVLVVDDVLTTGATLNACAAELRGAGAEVVWGAAVARH